MQRVLGIETEYGITVDGRENFDVVHESIELVRCYTEHGASMKWDYQLEDPHQDARGFRARELMQDTDEAAYYEIDKHRPLSFEEIKSDLVLSNGARFYNDHAHPEYSTPECGSLLELVAQEKAGERILTECARRRNEKLPEGQLVRLYKNNTDFSGHSYGCHDNYLMRRDVPWDRIVSDIVPFLVTRQIFAGAGKMGIESEGRETQAGHFQISQRADFFSVLVSIDTMNRRPLVNTRDEPHADASRFRRFHVIVGDSNMNEIATALKVGTTSLVLALIEQGNAPQISLANSIEALKSISRDPSYGWIVELRDGHKISAIEIQRLYLERAIAHCGARDDETKWLLHEWETVLADLEQDVNRCRDRIDWVAKKILLDAFRDSEKLALEDPWLQSIDLEYHNVSLEQGLYYELVNSGAVRRLVSEPNIKEAIFQPPTSTRAFFRGRSVARFNSQIASIQWDEIIFNHASKNRHVPLAAALNDPDLARLNAIIRESGSDADFFARLDAEFIP